MDIKDLPEITSLEDDDYFVIQSGDVTGRIQKSNLNISTNMNIPITISSNPPSNPNIGDAWIQTDGNELIETWYANSYGGEPKWMSGVKSSSSGSFSKIYLDSGKEYLFDINIYDFDILLTSWSFTLNTVDVRSNTERIYSVLNHCTLEASNFISIMFFEPFFSNQDSYVINNLNSLFNRNGNFQSFKMAIGSGSAFGFSPRDMAFNSSLFYRHVYVVPGGD